MIGMGDQCVVEAAAFGKASIKQRFDLLPKSEGRGHRELRGKIVAGGRELALLEADQGMIIVERIVKQRFVVR